MIGTLRYLAPEVQRGARATARSDLYSLGVLLREHGAAAAPDVDALTERLTAADPRQRPRSARAALEQLEANVPIAPTRRLASPPRAEPGRWRRARALTPARRARVLWVALAAVVAIALVAVAAGGGADSDPGVPQPAPKDAPLERQLDALERGVRQIGGR